MYPWASVLYWNGVQNEFPYASNNNVNYEDENGVYTLATNPYLNTCTCVSEVVAWPLRTSGRCVVVAWSLRGRCVVVA